MKMNRVLTLLILVVFLIPVNSSAQILEHFVPENRLPSLGSGDLQIGDFNNDGLMDVVYPTDPNGLALNDGLGSMYQDFQKPFESNGNRISAVGDLDGDGDLDMVASTGNWNATPGSKVFRIYFNDGNGHLELDENQLFQGLSDGGLEISDVDQDGDQDIFLTGIYFTGMMHSYLFYNDGSGVFTMEQLDNVVAMCEGDIALEDFTGDGYPDLLFAGIMMQIVPDTSMVEGPKFYVNDGSGHFEEISSYDLPNSDYSEIGVADIDSDNDLDLVLADDANQIKLFLNNGNGSFEESIDLFENVSYEREIEFGDIDNNGFIDLILIGNNSADVKVYLNNGNYSFIEKVDHGIPEEIVFSFKLRDLNNNGSPDLILNSTIYYNDGTGRFQSGEVWFPIIEQSFIKTIDFDGDEDLDVLYFGYRPDSTSLGSIYLNNKSDGFSFSGLIFQSDFRYLDAEAIHLNQDDYEDLIVLVDSSIHYFINDEGNNFMDASLDLFTDLSWTNILSEDLNHDGTKDLILSGYSDDGDQISFIYQGLDNGQYELVKELNYIIRDIERISGDTDDIDDFLILTSTSLFYTLDLFYEVGGEYIEDFFAEPEALETLVVGPFFYFKNYIEVIEDTTGSYIVFNEFNSSQIYKKQLNNSIEEQFYSGPDGGIISVGDVNLDGYAEYIYTEKVNFFDKISTVVGLENQELYTVDSILAPRTKFLKARDYIVEDFDLDGDTDLLIMDESGEINYLVNPIFEPSSVDLIPEKIAYVLYPNPVVNDLLFIEFLDESSEDVTFTIYDNLGRLVESGTLERSGTGQNTISLNNLMSGTYILKIQQGDTISSQPIIVQSK